MTVKSKIADDLAQLRSTANEIGQLQTQLLKQIRVLETRLAGKAFGVRPTGTQLLLDETPIHVFWERTQILFPVPKPLASRAANALFDEFQRTCESSLDTVGDLRRMFVLKHQNGVLCYGSPAGKPWETLPSSSPWKRVRRFRKKPYEFFRAGVDGLL